MTPRHLPRASRLHHLGRGDSRSRLSCAGRGPEEMQIRSCSCAGYLSASERYTGDAADVTGHSREVSQGGALSIDATVTRHYCTLLTARFCVTLCDAASVPRARGESRTCDRPPIRAAFMQGLCSDGSHSALVSLTMSQGLDRNPELCPCRSQCRTRSTSESRQASLNGSAAPCPSPYLRACVPARTPHRWAKTRRGC